MAALLDDITRAIFRLLIKLVACGFQVLDFTLKIVELNLAGCFHLLCRLAVMGQCLMTLTVIDDLVVQTVCARISRGDLAFKLADALAN